MQVKTGDTVQMRDGTILLVTDAAYQDQGEYVLENPDTEKFEVFPPETIFVGVVVDTRVRGWSKGAPKILVSDMSEVVSILE